MSEIKRCKAAVAVGVSCTSTLIGVFVVWPYVGAVVASFVVGAMGVAGVGYNIERIRELKEQGQS